MNTLSFERFDETLDEGVSYTFKIDRIPIEQFDNDDIYDSVGFRDVLNAKFLEDTVICGEKSAPVLAWNGFDSVRAYVFPTEKYINWKIYVFYDDEEKEKKFLGEFNFDRNQYESTIQKIVEQAETDSKNEIVTEEKGIRVFFRRMFYLF